MMTVFTESGSIYEIDTDNRQLRRAVKGKGSNTQRANEEWKPFLQILDLEVGRRAYIVWEVDDQEIVRGTYISEIQKIYRR